MALGFVLGGSLLTEIVFSYAWKDVEVLPARTLPPQAAKTEDNDQQERRGGGRRRATTAPRLERGVQLGASGSRAARCPVSYS